MNIVVVGASGNIGTAVLRRLRGTAHRVVAAARRMPDWAASDSVRWVRCDATTDDVLTVSEGADVIVNLAWLLQPSHRPDVTWANNVGSAERILLAAQDNRVPKLVFASSVAAYSPSPTADSVAEEWPTHGASSAAYAREKAYIERMLDAFEASAPGCAVARMRPAFVFQRAAATEQRRLFAGPLLPGSLLRPDLLPFVPVPRGLRMQTVHADDVADAIVRAIEARAEGAYNLAGSGVLEGEDVAGILDARAVSLPSSAVRGALAAAWHLRAAPAPPALFDALMSLPIMSTRRAQEELGWAPSVSAADALERLISGMRHGTDHPTPPLDAATSGPLRSHEFETGVGSRP